MKTEVINILMIDDHAMILQGYVDALKNMEREMGPYRFAVEQAHSLGEGLASLEHTYKKRKLHLVLLDIGLPQEDHYMSGLDLGAEIRKTFPETKLIIITGYDNFPLIQKTMETLKPEGLLIKGELKPEGLVLAVREVLENIPHYTKTVRRYLTQINTKPTLLDHYDILLLFHLSEGKQTKELPKLLPLSLASIERRKRKLKELLNLGNSSSDIQLLNRAKEAGFL